MGGGASFLGGGCLLPGGVPPSRGRRCLLPGGVSQHALRQTPPLLTESQTPVKTLPWPNFVAAGNKWHRYVFLFWEKCQWLPCSISFISVGCNTYGVGINNLLVFVSCFLGGVVSATIVAVLVTVGLIIVIRKCQQRKDEHVRYIYSQLTADLSEELDDDDAYMIVA